MSEQQKGHVHVVWTRVKEKEKLPIIGWFEREDTGSIITLTKGQAHLVHRGKAFMVLTPEDQFSSNVETIASKLQRMLP